MMRARRPLHSGIKAATPLRAVQTCTIVQQRPIAIPDEVGDACTHDGAAADAIDDDCGAADGMGAAHVNHLTSESENIPLKAPTKSRTKQVAQSASAPSSLITPTFLPRRRHLDRPPTSVEASAIHPALSEGASGASISAPPSIASHVTQKQRVSASVLVFDDHHISYQHQPTPFDCVAAPSHCGLFPYHP